MRRKAPELILPERELWLPKPIMPTMRNTVRFQPASNYVEEACGHCFLEGNNITAPSEVWIGFTKAAITKTMTGSTVSEELSFTGYKRIKTTLAEWEKTAGSGESTATKYVNKVAYQLAKASAITGITEGNYFFLATKETGGEVLFFEKLAEKFVVANTTTTVEFEAKKLEVSFS